MIPLTALVILIIVVASCTITLIIAIFSELRHRDEDDNEMVLPWTESAPDPATVPMRRVPLARSETPEAEYPPSLPDEELESLAEAESPPPLPTPVRDSTHEIIHLYTNEGRTVLSGARTAPATVTTFAEANSKWAYVGLKRAQSNVYERA